MSKKYCLSMTDIKKIARNIAILYSPVILIFFEQIQHWVFDEKILYALFLSTTIDIVRRYATDYTEKK